MVYLFPPHWVGLIKLVFTDPPLTQKWN